MGRDPSERFALTHLALWPRFGVRIQGTDFRSDPGPVLLREASRQIGVSCFDGLVGRLVLLGGLCSVPGGTRD